MGGVYQISGGCDEVPGVEEWTEHVNAASTEELLRLRQHALGCLAQNIKNQRWGVLVGIAERVLTDRNVQYQ
jgi:hypothetical protein